MIFQGSRYEPLVRQVTTVRTSDGEQHAALPLRLPPPTPATYRHTVTVDDRLDLLAARFYGKPDRFWRIADANLPLHPEELTGVGRVILVPPDTAG